MSTTLSKDQQIELLWEILGGKYWASNQTGCNGQHLYLYQNTSRESMALIHTVSGGSIEEVLQKYLAHKIQRRMEA